jgi:hypothetical protein
MNAAFEVHMLNEKGKKKATQIAEKFDELLGAVHAICNIPPGGSRYLFIVATKLEEAFFFAKKAVANDRENREGE